MLAYSPNTTFLQNKTDSEKKQIFWQYKNITENATTTTHSPSEEPNEGAMGNKRDNTKAI